MGSVDTPVLVMSMLGFSTCLQNILSSQSHCHVRQGREIGKGVLDLIWMLGRHWHCLGYARVSSRAGQGHLSPQPMSGPAA